MPYMFVTLAVSKVTGWLKAFAACRVERGGGAMPGEVCGPEGGGPGEPQGVGQRLAQTRRARGGPATGGLWGQSTRGGAHVEHAVHTHA